MVIKNRKAGRKPQSFQDWGIKLHRGERNFNKLKVEAALGWGGGYICEGTQRLPLVFMVHCDTKLAQDTEIRFAFDVP